VLQALSKHLVDLAYLAREHATDINHDNVAELVRQKFAKEKGAYRYVLTGIHAVADLPAAFAKAQKLKDLRDDWGRFVDSELLFLPGERRESDNTTLLKIENVERQAIEFWQSTLALLR
jgi:hypothetical protein